MNIFSVLQPRLIFAALLAALVGWHFYAVHEARKEGHAQGAAEVTAQWNEERNRIVAAALAASQEARQKEAAYANAVEATRDHYTRESAITKAAAGRSARELERLRLAVAAATGSGAGGRGSAGTHQDARNLQAFGDAAGVDETAAGVGVLLLACGTELQDVAREADELGDQIKGLHRHVDTLLERIAGSPPHAAMPTP